MTFEKLFSLEFKATEANKNKKWILQFDQELTDLQYKRIKQLIEEQAEARGFGDFLILGPNCKLIES